ncbi:MAG: nucleotidyltransferase family protein [Sphingopyxis sp.]|nr:nucleotidyltransferase family protein [Sphingopyxis sp.]
MDQTALLETLLLSDPLRRRALQVVAECGLPDCWIGAGFARDAVWDHLHGYSTTAPHGDVDVIWFRNEPTLDGVDLRVELELQDVMPELLWSVKNQARMHHRNGDSPYTSIVDAMRHWPETATAVAARLGPSGLVEINAPFGLDDLFALRLRPTPAFQANKHPIFVDRVSSKRWIERYPLLTLEPSATTQELH